MKASVRIFRCNQCGLPFHSEAEAMGHHLSTHRPKNAKPRIYGRCGDCPALLTAEEVITHHCDEADKRRASAGWGPVIAAVVIMAVIAWIIGRMMK